MVMKEREEKQENMDVKKHITPEEDKKLHEAYINALGEILENDDDDCRDDQNQSGRGVEVEAFAEVDDAWVRNRTKMIWIGERTLDFPLFYNIYWIHPGGFKRLPSNGQCANNDCRYTDKDK